MAVRYAAVSAAQSQDPALLLIDEATAGLAAEDEEEVQAALDHLMAGKTTVTVDAHVSAVARSVDGRQGEAR